LLEGLLLWILITLDTHIQFDMVYACGGFQVLDLMVRMLGFSDEDKQRIGAAQQGGRGVVRGVLGLPGRLVGGILGGSAADGQTNLASDNQVGCCTSFLMFNY